MEKLIGKVVLDWTKLDVLAQTYDKQQRGVTIRFSDGDVEYIVEMTKSNAKWLSRALKNAIKLCET